MRILWEDLLCAGRTESNAGRVMTPYDIGLVVFGAIAVAGILILVLDRGLKSKGRS